ncbi:MAG: hypothetical protein A2041_03745 [Bacteroidetes bacterium GWA2_31_9b]|nr:MAG: hypothetical protein A2041_03745 [Bacteroidetes bacterium GWA2_31_9b]
MKKIILILSLFIFSIQIQLFAQDNKSIVDILNSSIESTYLKDFSFKLEPNSVARYSVVLSKNTKYAFVIYQNETNQFDFGLYRDKSDKNLVPSKVEITKQIIKAEFINGKTGVYHLIIKNNSTKIAESALVLSFIEKIDTPETIEIPDIVDVPDAIEQAPEIPEPIDVVFMVVEQMPLFNGAKSQEESNKKFQKFITENTTYPQEAKDKKISGRVFVSYVVSENGYIKDAKIARGVHPSLDQEALRIIYASPKWEPGKQRGKNVNVSFTIPIEFKLE